MRFSSSPTLKEANLGDMKRGEYQRFCVCAFWTREADWEEEAREEKQRARRCEALRVEESWKHEVLRRIDRAAVEAISTDAGFWEKFLHSGVPKLISK